MSLSMASPRRGHAAAISILFFAKAWTGVGTQSMTMCGLPNMIPSNERANITLQGQSIPLGVVLVDWPSARVGSYLVKYLAEEVLGYNTIFAGRADGSFEAVQYVSGCLEPGASSPRCDVSSFSRSHLAWEIWFADNQAQIEALEEELKTSAAVNLGRTGYEGIESVYIFNEVVSEAYATDGLYLGYYKSWNSSWSDVSLYFAKHTDINATKLMPCQGTRMYLRPQSMAHYEQITGDSDGVEIFNGSKVGKCVGGPMGVWWLSPSCRRMPTKCVPLISSGTGWGVDAFMQKSAAYDMSVAIGVATEENYATLPRNHRMAQYWWQPDTTFIDLAPVSVVFPVRDAAAWARNDKRTHSERVETMKFGHHDLEMVAGRVYDLMMNIVLPMPQLRDILLDLKLNGIDESLAVCKWLKANAATWERWIPDAIACKSGEGIVDSLANFVTNISQATSCSSCTPGKYSKEIVDQNSYFCSLCPAGKFSEWRSAACINCTAGRFSPDIGSSCIDAPAGDYVPDPGSQSKKPCMPGTYSATPGRSECPACTSGFYTGESGATECAICARGKFATLDQTNCITCYPGSVPDSRTNTCKPCPGGEVAVPGDSECTPCAIFTIASTDTCELDVLLLGCAIAGVLTINLIIGYLLRREWRREAFAKLQRNMAVEFRSLLEDHTRRKDIELLQVSLKKSAELHMESFTIELEKQLSMQRKRYVDFDALQQIVEERDLRLLRGSWLIHETLFPRFLRQQQLESDAHYTPHQFFSEQGAIVVAALSYCWLHCVNPDPKKLYLNIIRRALKLRLRVEGPGQVKDIAFFVDYMAIAQHGEAGDEDDPIRGEVRTLEEQRSFQAGLSVVNLLYGHQQTETWILQWTPIGTDRPYDSRAWPAFERCVSSLLKHPAKLLNIGEETKDCQSWIDVFKIRAKRLPPYNPDYFTWLISTKSLTNDGDKDVLLAAYSQAFSDVIGHAYILWFVAQDWGDMEAAFIADVFPCCDNLHEIILASNNFTFEGATKLVEASCSCKTLVKMDLFDNPIERHEAVYLQKIWLQGGKPENGLRFGRELSLRSLDRSYACSKPNRVAVAVIVSFSVEKLEYSDLIADAGVYGAFKSEVKEIIAREAGNASMAEYIEVELEPSRESVLVKSKVKNDRSDLTSVQEALTVSSTLEGKLCDHVQNVLASVKMAHGPITVSNISVDVLCCQRFCDTPTDHTRRENSREKLDDVMEERKSRQNRLKPTIYSDKFVKARRVERSEVDCDGIDDDVRSDGIVSAADISLRVASV